MKSILVGVDGSIRGEHALAWAAKCADREDASLTLLAIIEPSVERQMGLAEKTMTGAANAALISAEQTVYERYPHLQIETQVVRGEVVESLIDAAESFDLIVVGSHHGKTIGETIGGAKGLRVSVSTTTPTVVVPADYDPEYEGNGIMVGVGPDEVSVNAIRFGAERAFEFDKPLKLVSAWGLPAFLSRSSEALGGGLGPVGDRFQRTLDEAVAQLKEMYPDMDIKGEAIEGSSPTRVLLEECKDCDLLVLGTHSRNALGRALFGSITHSVLLNLTVPTVIVPTGKKEQ